MIPAPSPARRPGRWTRVRIVAGEEYRRALETKWLFGFTALFAVLVLGLSYFGLAQSREVGFQGFSRVTLSLMNLVLFLVPLTALVVGVGSVAGGGESLPLLLAQPVSRGEVLIGKYLGLGLALTVAQALGFGGGGLVVAFQAGSAHAGAFAVLCALSMALGWLSLAAALCLAAVFADRLRALSAAVLLWLAMVVLYDVALLGVTAMLRGVSLQPVLVPALLVNPVDLVRVLITIAVGSGALFGPTSAVLVQSFGGAGGALIAVGVLALETVVPLAVALRVFRRRDW
jgi:Cu-processing system permease protein